METKYIIGIVVAVAILLVIVAVGLGMTAYMKGGFGEIKFMAGESELDKLIKKINSYLRR